MSINDQINRIKNEVNEQEKLIAELDAAVDALPEADSSGGNIETCTLNLDFTATSGCELVAYTAYENNVVVGKVIGYIMNMETYETIVLENLVCNSAVFIYGGAGWTNSAIIPTNVSVLGHSNDIAIICAPTTPNTNATIIFNDYID